MMQPPLAYMITWTTYGTWLPGDARGWVATGEQRIQSVDDARRERAELLMRQEPVVLDSTQRAIVDDVIRTHCKVRCWPLHALNVRTNHVHLVATAGAPPEKAMGQFKAWCSRRLNEHLGRVQLWWTRHGSTRWINDESHLRHAIRYVLEGQ